jgi:hypothetical protein
MRGGRRRIKLYTKAFSAFVATPVYDFSAARFGHSRQEAVPFMTLSLITFFQHILHV